MDNISLPYTDESTFKTEDIVFNSEHYEISQNLHKAMKSKSPIMVDSDKKSLLFFVDKSKNRVDRETQKGVYKVVIKPLN